MRKHSRASRVDVELSRGPGYVFTVRDDGCGFDAQKAVVTSANHVGLRIMQERASRIGGTVACVAPATGRSRAPRSVRAREPTRPRDPRLSERR